MQQKKMPAYHYRYLSDDQLKRLESYKYCAVDTSPVSKYVMHPFWNTVIEFVPMWIAPNVLTLAGFSFTLLNVFALSYYDYYFYASSDTGGGELYPPVPNWVWLMCAVNLFMAHTLDGIDGKQARRTKATGPLGELMDHGVDSWTTCFIPFCVYSMFGRCEFSFNPVHMLSMLWSIFLTFYLSHWEKYNTGILYLPWNYDLSQLFLFGCLLTTYFKSYKVWKFVEPHFGLKCCEIFELLLYLGSIVLTTPMSIYTVYSAIHAGKSKYSSFNETLRPLIPVTLLFVVSMSWAHFSRSDVVSQDPKAYYFTVGTIFSNIACRLIISQMSSTRCEIINILSVLFTLVASAVLFSPSLAKHELLILRLFAFAITLAHLHYVVCVIRQMCSHFRINCLTLKRGPSSFMNHNNTGGDSSRQHLLPQNSSPSSSD